MFEAWQLAAIDAAGYNGITDDHIEDVASSLRSSGITEVNWETFEKHCRLCGIDPHNFTQGDIELLERELNE
jgi:hypothetical protein